MSRRGTLIFATIVLTGLPSHARAAEPLETPGQLIRDVVFNEASDHRRHQYFEYLDVRRSGPASQVKTEVETPSGRLSRLIAQDGKPLTAEQQWQESRRLQSLLQDSGQQEKLERDYRGDEDRIARILGLLPDGFLYEYAGHFTGPRGEEICLRFKPNPAFRPPTYEARVFHGMAGEIWVNSREKRLSRLRGSLVANVDFGYGLLGRLDEGGTFEMERIETTPGNWKTRVLNVHITGHVILLKSIAKDQEETRSDFQQVPSDLTLAQAESIVNQPPAVHQGDRVEVEAPKFKPAKNAALTWPAALTLK